MLQLDKEHAVNVDTLFGHNKEDGQSDCKEKCWDVKMSLEEGAVGIPAH